MNLSEPFIRRPVMTTLSMLSILLFGAIGYKLLPVSDLPNVDYPTIQVNANLPGASPDTMASSVATPLEKEFTTIAGVDSMSSSSSLGSTSITIQFVLTRDIDAAAQDVQSAIARAVRRLPADMSAPPSYRKVNPADSPILWLSLVSPNLPMSALDEYGQTLIAQRISMVDGVAQVQVNGSQKYAVRIELDPYALSSRGLGIDEVANTISDYNVNMPLGTLNGPNQSATILANGQLTEAASYMPLIVAYRNGQPVRLREIGTAKDSVENDKVAAWYCTGGQRNRSIVLSIQKQPGTNTVEVAQAIKDLLPSFRSQLPASVSLEVLRDGSTPIKASAHDVQFTLVLTLALVVMVIFLFLRNLSATIIPSLTLPMAIIGTFAAMYVLNYSLDNLSLMALTLSVGFVVDDAIVMLENIVRHMEMGKSRLQAALDGSREIGFTIITMTISLAAVFIPVLFMPGLVGRLFREFSVTIGVAVLVSGFVALTLTPMLASRFLRDPRQFHHWAVYRAAEVGFNVMQSVYAWMLRWVLGHRLTTMLFSLVILVATGMLFWQIPKGFIPSEDRDLIQIRTDASQDISFASMVEHQMVLADILQKNPNIDRYMTNVGTNSGRFTVVLKPRADRTKSADEVIEELRPQFAKVPGIRAFPSNPPPVSVSGRSTSSLYQLTLQGPDTVELYRYGGELEESMRQIAEIQDVVSDLQVKNPQLNVDIDRDKAFTLGVSPAQIESALYNAYGTRQISTIFAPQNQYQVIMGLKAQYQTDPSVLSLLYVRSSKGGLVPLKAVAGLHEDAGPLSVNHSGQLPSVTISFNLKPGVSLSQAVERVNELTRQTMPGTMTASFQGTAQAFQSSIPNMIGLLGLAIVVIYVVLGILYESFYHPITILSALPFAGFGALLTLMIFGQELNVYGFIGIVMLVGLVKKNGIMMVDFAIELQRSAGKSAQEAIAEACLVRFRPIMMTTMAALMAGIPIAVGYGAGAESRQPLGLAVVGGLIFSQTLTLFVTPVFFVYMERVRHFISSPSQHAGEKPPVLEPAALPQAPRDI